MSNRFKDAQAAQAGACNPRPIVAALGDDASAQWARAEALYAQSEADRKRWQGLALVAEKQRDALLAAMTNLTKCVMTDFIGKRFNPYSEPTVKAALKAIATATGKSTFGNDWMDALNQEGDAP